MVAVGIFEVFVDELGVVLPAVVTVPLGGLIVAGVVLRHDVLLVVD
jgi:hypothetical protein